MEAALQDLANLGAVASDAGQQVSELSEITLLGHFSLSLSVDLVLCRLILFGIFFGCPIDAIVIAASLSLSQQDVFSLPSRLIIKEEEQFSQMLFKSMKARFYYDQGSYSNAIMVCNLFREWIVWLNSSIDQPEQHSKHFLVRPFAHNSAVRWEWMLPLESTVSEIASRVLIHVPEALVLHGQLQNLASPRHSRRLFSHSEGTGKQRNTFQLNFCDDQDILKSQMAASFSHQLLYGASECTSFVPWKKKRATSLVKTIKHLGLDPSRTLVMKRLEHSALDALTELTRRIVPHSYCDVRVIDDTGFIHFNHSFNTNPKTVTIWQQEDCHECAQDPSFTEGLPQEANFFWQYGGRKPVWKVEGISAEFTKPRIPYAVSWYRLSSERENVHVTSWRNRTGCMVDFGEDSCCSIHLGIASSLQGGEIDHLVSAKGITVLPSLRTGPSAILMVLAFQTLHADLGLCVDTTSKKITSIRCNSQQLPLTEENTLEADDIIRINALREAISTTLCSSSATIPMDMTSTILPLLKCMLRRHSQLKMQLLQVLCNITLKSFGKMPLLP